MLKKLFLLKMFLLFSYQKTYFLKVKSIHKNKFFLSISLLLITTYIIYNIKKNSKRTDPIIINSIDTSKNFDDLRRIEFSIENKKFKDNLDEETKKKFTENIYNNIINILKESYKDKICIEEYNVNDPNNVNYYNELKNNSTEKFNTKYYNKPEYKAEINIDITSKDENLHKKIENLKMNLDQNKTNFYSDNFDSYYKEDFISIYKNILNQENKLFLNKIYSNISHFLWNFFIIFDFENNITSNNITKNLEDIDLEKNNIFSQFTKIINDNDNDKIIKNTDISNNEIYTLYKDNIENINEVHKFIKNIIDNYIEYLKISYKSNVEFKKKFEKILEQKKNIENQKNLLENTKNYTININLKKSKFNFVNFKKNLKKLLTNINLYENIIENSNDPSKINKVDFAINIDNLYLINIIKG